MSQVNEGCCIAQNSYLGPDRLELIIFDITEKKIDNPHSRLLLCFSL